MSLAVDELSVGEMSVHCSVDKMSGSIKCWLMNCGSMSNHPTENSQLRILNIWNPYFFSSAFKEAIGFQII